MMYGLSDTTMEKMNGVFSHFPEIEEVVVYGSRAKGNYRNGSDIDLTMKGDGLSDGISSKIWLALDDLLLPYMIDLSIYRQISNPDLIDHINRVGQIFYKRLP
jgi:predicted nucleotidyltransferase